MQRADRAALLLRLNPKHWPSWERQIVVHPKQWFPLGRRRAESIQPGLQTVVLGTGDLGLVGFGETTTGSVVTRDPFWHEAPPGLQDAYRQEVPRVQVLIQLRRVPIERVRLDPLADAARRRTRETVTWLSTEELDRFLQIAAT